MAAAAAAAALDTARSAGFEHTSARRPHPEPPLTAIRARGAATIDKLRVSSV